MNKLLAVWILSVAGLLLLGILAIKSATGSYEHPDRFHAHLLWVGLGLSCCLASSWLPYSSLQTRKIPQFSLGLAILLLILVLIPGIGEEINGSRRWFRCGGQPSELAKLALILMLADYGSRHLPSMPQFKRGFLAPAGLAGIVVGLIFLEQDWGTAILTGAIAVTLLIAAGGRWRYILSAVVAVCVLLFVLLQNHPERLRRLPILVEQMPGDHRDVWQVWQSVLSFAKGGFLGTSPGLGIHKYGFVPEQETDFIFSLIGEELGFLGASTVVFLLISLVLCGVFIAWRISDAFGQLLVLGITFAIGFQALINICVVTSLLPNKGLPLPFISYGGSNLVCLMAGIGCVVSAARLAPRSASVMLPVFERVRETENTAVGGQPIELASETRMGPFRRRLLCLCYGPNWPYWIAIRRPYQLPPKRRGMSPSSRIRQWLLRVGALFLYRVGQHQAGNTNHSTVAKEDGAFAIQTRPPNPIISPMHTRRPAGQGIVVHK